MMTSAPFKPLAHVGEDFRAEVFDTGRQQRRRADEAQAHVHLRQQHDVGTGHARMGDVATNGHRQAFQPAKAAADGECIEQGLGGVFMLTVTSVDHRTGDLLCQQLHRTG
jgi:hypothetical protein